MHGRIPTKGLETDQTLRRSNTFVPGVSESMEGEDETTGESTCAMAEALPC